MSYDDWKTTDREGDEQAGIERQQDLQREKAEEEQAADAPQDQPIQWGVLDDAALQYAKADPDPNTQQLVAEIERLKKAVPKPNAVLPELLETFAASSQQEIERLREELEAVTKDRDSWRASSRQNKIAGLTYKDELETARRFLIESLHVVGGIAADDVSLDFLAQLPAEIAGRVAKFRDELTSIVYSANGQPLHHYGTYRAVEIVISEDHLKKLNQVLGFEQPRPAEPQPIITTTEELDGAR